MANFGEWFKRATGNEPFPYQRRFAEEGEIPALVDVPTALGTTAMAVLGWSLRVRGRKVASSGVCGIRRGRLLNLRDHSKPKSAKVTVKGKRKHVV
jgi:hypothetical protein